MGGLFGKKPEEDMTFRERLKSFLAVHWRGVVCVLTPIILMILLFPFPPKHYQWCGFTLLLMAVFWVTECIPLAVTSFLPVVIFPMTGVMSTTATCKAYMNDTILMFVGSLILAYSVEQSGLHKRFAYAAIRLIGYSHVKLLFAMCTVTMFVSMWVTNTAATTMMVPILFALLKVFNDHGICSMWETTKEGDKIASDITTCYFCAITYSATIGGIGTLVGTATNLAFKGLFQTTYPLAPEYLSFLKFSAFAVPYMLVMEFFIFVYLAILYFGAGRPRSETAKLAIMTDKGILAAKKAIQDDTVKMGRFTFWEGIVLILFSLAMIGFFSRSPQLFPGWGDRIHAYFYILDSKYIRDSALAMLICFLMFLLPSTLAIFNNCKAKFMNELPKGRIPSVLDWTRLNAAMPFSFMFLLGGGFALSDAAKNTGLNDKIGESLKFLKDLPNVLIILFIIILVVFITNFASNVAVANVMAPLAMQMAKEIHRNPLWYCIAAGFSASYCFMIPVGTPGNLIVQSAANIPTRKMIIAGLGPTITTIIITWVAISFWAPIIWPLHLMPIWTGVVLAPAPPPAAAEEGRVI